MNVAHKKIKANIGLADASYVWLFLVVDRFFHSIMEAGGLYSLVLLPLFELGKAFLRGGKNEENNEQIGSKPLVSGNLFQGLKLTTTTLGILVGLSGNLTLGFGLIIATTFAQVLRNMFKTGHYWQEGNQAKVEKNLAKILIGGVIAGGFTLLTFYASSSETLGLIGWCMSIVGTSYVVLSALPGKLAGLMKKQDALIPSAGGLSSSVSAQSQQAQQAPASGSPAVLLSRSNSNSSNSAAATVSSAPV